MTGAPILTICCGALVACATVTCVAQFIGSRGFPLPAIGERMGCVDGLRGYLAVFVMIYHFILYIEVTRLGGVWSRPNLRFFDSLGPGSVNLFFMTTGFLFYPRIMGGFASVDWLTLYVSRVFRIVPLLIFLVLAASALILARMDFTPTEPFKTTIFSMMLWIVSWDHPDLWGFRESGRLASMLWSLWFEWLFYLFVLPVCAIAMSMRGNAPRWAVPVGMVILSIGIKSFHLASLIDFLPLFGIGMISFELKSRRAIAEALTSRTATVTAFLCLIVGALVPSGVARMILHAFFFMCVACGCSFWGLLKTRGARVLGEVSYGIYALHMLVLSILFVSFAEAVGRLKTDALPVLMPIVAIAVLASGGAAFLLVERPGIRSGKALAKMGSFWIRRRLNDLKSARSTWLVADARRMP